MSVFTVSRPCDQAAHNQTTTSLRFKFSPRFSSEFPLACMRKYICYLNALISAFSQEVFHYFWSSLVARHVKCSFTISLMVNLFAIKMNSMSPVGRRISRSQHKRGGEFSRRQSTVGNQNQEFQFSANKPRRHFLQIDLIQRKYIAFESPCTVQNEGRKNRL